MIRVGVLKSVKTISFAVMRTEPFSSPITQLIYFFLAQETKEGGKGEHTAQSPAMLATIPPEIIMGFTPLVLLKIIPLRAPATILFAASCFPRA